MFKNSFSIVDYVMQILTVTNVRLEFAFLVASDKKFCKNVLKNTV